MKAQGLEEAAQAAGQRQLQGSLQSACKTQNKVWGMQGGRVAGHAHGSPQQKLSDSTRGCNQAASNVVHLCSEQPACVACGNTSGGRGA